MQHIVTLLSTVKDCHPKTPCMAATDPDHSSLHPMHLVCTSDPQIIYYKSPCKHSPLGGAHSSDAGEALQTLIPPAWLHGDQHAQITTSFTPCTLPAHQISRSPCPKPHASTHLAWLGSCGEAQPIQSPDPSCMVINTPRSQPAPYRAPHMHLISPDHHVQIPMQA